MKWEKADFIAGLTLLGALGLAISATFWLRRTEGTGDVYFAEFDRLEALLSIWKPAVSQATMSAMGGLMRRNAMADPMPSAVTIDERIR